MNQKLLVYLFIGGTVAFLTFVTIYDSKKKDKAEKESEQVYVEMPDADVKQVSESKTHAYATFAENKKTQDIEDYWNQCNKEQEEAQEQKKQEPPQTHMFSSSNQPVTTPQSSRPPASHSAPYRETAQEREERHQRRREEAMELAERMRNGDEQQQKEAEKKQDTTKVPETIVTRNNAVSQSRDGWGSGISSLGSKPQNDQGDERPLKCMFSRQEKLKNGQRVAVILLEEIRVNGIIIPKNTHLMGTCRLSSRLEVSFDSIEIGGRIMPLGYEAYDMDGSKGIYCPDVANVGKTARERGTDIARNTLSSRLGRVAQDVVSTGVSIARSSSGEPTVTVPSGYNFFIVKKKEL